jgi:hypothetical protein
MHLYQAQLRKFPPTGMLFCDKRERGIRGIVAFFAFSISRKKK